MKSLIDYWRNKFVELQKEFNEEKKKNNSEKRELKDKMFEQSVTIKELQAKIEELEKVISSKDKEVENSKVEQNSIIEKHKQEIETLKVETIENIHLIEQQKNKEEAVLVSEFVRFLKKDVGYVNGLARVLQETCKRKMQKNVIENLIGYTEWMTQLADELSWFSQPFKKEDGTVNPDVLIDEVLLEFKETAAEKNIEITKDISEKIPEANIFNLHLKTVFSEIIRNCFDALSEGIPTKNKTIVIKMYAKDNNTIIEFTDTGRGIPEHLIEKIWKPFFSTKKKIGFGLGMTRIHKISEAYGFQVNIISEEGIGTTVKLTI